MALNNETEIASIRARLKELDAERDALTDCIERLASQPSSGANCKSAGASVIAASTAAEKITLFRRLFAGRTEVFPVRWENRNTGKSWSALQQSWFGFGILIYCPMIRQRPIHIEEVGPPRLESSYHIRWSELGRTGAAICLLLSVKFPPVMRLPNARNAGTMPA
jgi:hypothetical protein